MPHIYIVDAVGKSIKQKNYEGGREDDDGGGGGGGG